MERDTAHPEANALDREDLMARCMGNLEFAERILGMFQERCGEDLAQLEAAAESGDVKQVALLAHRLKGASANVAAPGMQARAAEIEAAARQEALAEIPASLNELKQEWSRFTSEVSGLA